MRCMEIYHYFETWCKMCILYSQNFTIDDLFFLKVKKFLKVISISLFSKYIILLFQCFLLILFFFEVIHILLTIVIMYYISLISFGTNKIFKFQISRSLKKIIIIIKTYQIISIDDINQIIDRHIQIYNHVDCVLV